jgi:hypothetical protein
VSTLSLLDWDDESMKGELKLPCCCRSRPFYTKSQGQGVSSCLERSGAPPGISRQAPAKWGGTRLFGRAYGKGKGQARLQASLGKPQQKWGVPGSLGAPMARCQGQVRLQHPQASPSRGGEGGGGPGPLGMSLAFGNTHPPLKIGIKMEGLCSGLQFISSLPKHW